MKKEGEDVCEVSGKELQWSGIGAEKRKGDTVTDYLK